MSSTDQRSSERDPFEAHAQRVHGVVLLHLSGELDIATIDGLASALSHHCNGPLVVDLSRVTFCDASALRVLLAAQTSLRRAGHGLVLQMPSTSVHRLLSIAGVTDRFAFAS